MQKTCPHCGKVSNEETPRFCSGCGARMDGNSPAGYPVFPWYPGYRPMPSKQKNAMIAGFCSTFLPGLGQVYNGQTGKGFIVFLLTLIGLVMILIPGLIVWLYGMYDAYSVAGKMNTGELPFRETRMLHVALFIVFAVIVVVIALIIIIAIAMATLMPQLDQLGTGNVNQVLGSGDLNQLLDKNTINQMLSNSGLI